MSTTPAVDAAVLQTLADGFAGRVLQSSDDDYEGARRVHNGLIDRRPAVIAQCVGSVDVAAAVRFATANGLEIAVRGGGHNVAGRSVCEGGLMIDLSQMRGVAVDAEARTASAQGGATLVGSERRCGQARAGGHRRRHLQHRGRRLHAGRRAGLADVDPGPVVRQPDRRAAGDRGG